MKKRRKDRDQAMHGTTDGKRNDRDDGGSMSPSMRQLILSFVGTDSERVWDADAFASRSVPAA
jgi:hypothetical protein